MHNNAALQTDLDECFLVAGGRAKPTQVLIHIASTYNLDVQVKGGKVKQVTALKYQRPPRNLFTANPTMDKGRKSPKGVKVFFGWMKVVSVVNQQYYIIINCCLLIINYI